MNFFNHNLFMLSLTDANPTMSLMCRKYFCFECSLCVYLLVCTSLWYDSILKFYCTWFGGSKGGINNVV